MKRVGSLASALILMGFWFFSSPVYADDNVHVVEPGETLSEIAVAYDTDVETLRILNGLSDIDLVWVGLPLTVPLMADPTAGDIGSPGIDVESGPATYTAQYGDTLSQIASAHGMSLASLVEINRISLSRPLYVGEVLSLRPEETPVTIDVARDGVSEVSNAATDDGSGQWVNDVQGERVHAVQAGEHLGIIAEIYTTNARKIAELNNLSNASLLTPGQKLLIPSPSFDEMAKLAPVGEDGFHTHPVPLSETEKWIDVDLSEQRVVAYEGDWRWPSLPSLLASRRHQR